MIRRLIQWTVERTGERFEMDKRPLVIPAEQIRYAVIRQIREGNAVVLAENGGRSPERGQVGCGECPRKLDKSGQLGMGYRPIQGFPEVRPKHVNADGHLKGKRGDKRNKVTNNR